MADEGNVSQAHEPKHTGTSTADPQRPAARTRRARIYEALKHMLSGVWSEPEAATIEPEQPNDASTNSPQTDAVQSGAAREAQNGESSSPPAGPDAASVAARSSDVLDRIRDAVAGLVFTSETDAPVEAVALPAVPSLSPETLRAHEGIGAAEPLATDDIDHFFRNVTTPRDWHEEAEKEQVRRFTALRDLLKTELNDIVVYRFGTTAIDVYVLGHDAGGTIMGIHTKVVET